MGNGFIRGYQNLKYIIDDSPLKDIKKIKCKFKGCITILSQMRRRVGAEYCSYHTNFITLNDMDLLPLKQKRVRTRHK